MKKSLSLYFLFLFVWSPFSFAQVSTGDSTALVALFDNTGGNGWTDTTKWKTGNPVGTWFGVSVSNGRVVTLNLAANNLTGTVPSSIGNLTNLTQLQLFNNQLSGTIPSQIGNLVNLTSLGLENNQFSGTIPTAISNMTILSSLTISNNQLTDSVPVVFKDLSSLQQFDIRNNRLNILPDLSTIGTLTNLRTENNRFSFEDLEPNIGIGTFTYSPQDSIGSYASVNAAEGTVLQLTVTVGGTNNTYQWKKNNAAIPGATNDTLQIDSVKIGDAGTYTCDITNTLATALTLRRRTSTVTVTGTSPGAPSGLTATAVSTSQINLSWTKGTGIFIRSRIYRSTSAGSGFLQIDSITNNTATTYSNAGGLNSKTVYFYQVTAVGNFGVSSVSNTANDTTFNNSPTRVLSIADTSITEGFPKIFYRKLTHIFSDIDDATLTYSAQANVAQILASISNDSLYLKGVIGFSGIAAVTVSGSDGVSSATDTFNVTLLADLEPPVISSIQKPASSPVNTAFNVSCTVTDNVSTSAVRIFYKAGGSATFDSVAMSAAGITFSAQVPSSAATMEGVEIYIKAVDNGGNITSTDTSGVPVSFTQISSTLAGSEYATGIQSSRWRLVSVPVNLTNKNLSGLFSGISSSLWTAYNGSGAKVSSILPAQAFWFFHKSGNDALSAAASAGVTNDPSGVQVILAPQAWTLVGTPFTTTIAAVLDQLQFSGPWTYTGTGTEVGGWSKVTSMKPFGGYAIYNKNLTAATLTLTPGGITVSKSVATNPEEFKLHVTATAVKDGLTYKDRSNGFTILNAENAELYNDPEPENIGDYLSAYFTDGNKKFSYVFQNSENEGQSIDMVIESSMDDISFDLDFEIETMKNDRLMKIYDYTLNTFVDAEHRITSYRKHSGASKYRVIVGTAQYLDQTLAKFRDLPSNFSLLQNYPNPFNPSTKISYALSKQSRVTMTIYNILGQEIKTVLSRRNEEVGIHAVEWNGRDYRDREVSSGVYLYRIQAEAVNGDIYTQTRKMLYIK